LEQRVLFLSPTVGRWEGRYKIPPALIDMRIDGTKVDTAKKGTGVTTPYTVMLNDDWPMNARTGKSWKKVFADALKFRDNILAKLSIPFQQVGTRIIPMTKAREFFHQMIGLTLGHLRHQLRDLEDHREGNSPAAVELRSRIRRALRQEPTAHDSTPLFDESRAVQSFAYQWKSLADEFVHHLDSVFAQVRDNIQPRAAWDAVKERIPRTPVAMRAKFYTHILPVELAGGTDDHRVTMADLEAYDSVMRDAVNRTVELAVETVIARPRQELAEKLAALRELIDRDGKVTAKSFRPIQEAFTKLRLFQFAANPRLLEQIQGLENRMRITEPASLDSNTAASNGFTAALDSVIGECEDAVQQAEDMENFGKEYRAIDL
jgi:hypothetical protein